MNLKPGRYICEVTEPSNGWFGEAGEKATPFIRIPLIVKEGAYQGQEVTYRAWINDKSAKRTIDNLKDVFQWNGDIVALAQGDSPFVGMPCSIVTEEEEYEGKVRVAIKWLNKAEGPDKIMDANRALQLAQSLASRIGGQPRPAEQREARPKAAYGAPPPATRPRPPADPDLDAPEDDIPF
jgi:hypothetical protein